LKRFHSEIFSFTYSQVEGYCIPCGEFIGFTYLGYWRKFGSKKDHRRNIKPAYSSGFEFPGAEGGT
jgi:hypothetical protein